MAHEGGQSGAMPVLDLKMLVTIVTSLVAFATMTYEGVAWLDNTYASVLDVRLVELRLEQKIIGDRIKDIEQRMWVLEERYGETLQDAKSREVKEEYRKLKQEKDELLREMDRMRDAVLSKRYGTKRS